MPRKRMGDFVEWFVEHDWYLLPNGSIARARPFVREEEVWILIVDSPVEQVYIVAQDGMVYTSIVREVGNAYHNNRIRATFDAGDIQLYA